MYLYNPHIRPDGLILHLTARGNSKFRANVGMDPATGQDILRRHNLTEIAIGVRTWGL
jgi:hypothetical protein